VNQVVQRHLETWLEETRNRDVDGEPVSAYVERDSRHHLTSGILAHGVALGAPCHSPGAGVAVGAFAAGVGALDSASPRHRVELVNTLLRLVLAEVEGAL
jgi:hypothetical protein